MAKKHINSKFVDVNLKRDTTQPIGGADDRYRNTWNIHRSINHRWGRFEGGYVSGTAAIPDKPEGDE